MLVYIFKTLGYYLSYSEILKKNNLLGMLPIFLYLCVVFINCVINILIYFVIYKLLEYPKIFIWVDKKITNNNFMKKIINFYKKTSVLVIIYELLVLFFILLFLIGCFIIILIYYEKFI